MSRRSDHTGVPVDALEIRAYQVPTDAPESDGTYEWRATTLVVVEITAGGISGLGYTYADTATATLIRDLLAQVVRGRNAMNVAGAWSAMVAAIRNLGRPGIASMAISAVDTALWDLKARLLELPLVTLLGAVHDAVAVYGSGGFTSYTIKQLQEQLAGWVASGIARVKMKIGRDRSADSHRVRAARQAIGNAAPTLRRCQRRLLAQRGVIAPVPGIMRLFWAFSPSTPPESPSQEDSSLANMLDTLEA
ncbi:MAG: hypothetical protein WBQ11_01975, partial [Isosphaeraceae bacterium]